MTSSPLFSRRLRVTVVNALHVGSGDLLDPIDFTLGERGFRRLSAVRMVDALSERQRDSLVRAAEGTTRQLQKALCSEELRSAVEMGTVYCCRASAGAVDVVANLRGSEAARLEISPVVRTADGIPFLPGSSLKGAVRTALLELLWSKAREAGESPPDGVVWKARRLEAWLLTGREDMRPGQDPLRALAFSDFCLDSACAPEQVTMVDACRRAPHSSGDGGVPSLREVVVGDAHPDRPAAGGAVFRGEVRLNPLSETQLEAVAPGWRREFFSAQHSLFGEVIRACVLAYHPDVSRTRGSVLDESAREWLRRRIEAGKSARRVFAPLLLGWGSGVEAATLALPDGHRPRTPRTRWWTSAGTRLGAALVEGDTFP